MRKFLFILLFVYAGLVADSQNLTVEGAAPNMYVTHTVAPKENFYSVGRLYNQAPKSIASFNNITMEKGLTIGQHIKIPLNAQNFEAGEITNPGETLIPLTHIVDKSETLTRIGSNHNVTPALIRKWNNLSSDNIAPGAPLIVGHLRVKNDQGVASSANAAPQQSTVNEAPVRRAESVAVKETIAEPKKEEQVIAASPAPAEKRETAPVVSAEQTKPAETAAMTPVKEIPVKETPARQEQATSVKANEGSVINSSSIDLGSLSEGAFANNFPASKSLNTKSGEAATFKSTSGWQDKKYYVLMNNVTPGTILKVSAADNKFVYAKVLGSMPEMKENNGLLLRISSAAASHLGIIDPKFPVQISY